MRFRWQGVICRIVASAEGTGRIWPVKVQLNQPGGAMSGDGWIQITRRQRVESSMKISRTQNLALD